MYIYEIKITIKAVKKWKLLKLVIKSLYLVDWPTWIEFEMADASILIQNRVLAVWRVNKVFLLAIFKK